MKSSELVCSCALVGCMLLSGCYYNDYGQQGGGYGDPYGGGAYGNQQDGYNNPQGGYDYSQGQNPQGYPSTDPYAQQGGQGYPESGDVISLPSDGGSTDYNYGNSGYGSPSTTGGTSSYGATGGSGSTYTVKKGDNLYRIGKAHGASMQDIMQANGLTDSTIYPGQELRIP